MHSTSCGDSSSKNMCVFFYTLPSGRPSEAENCYRKALSIKGNHINANINMGHLCRLQQRWTEARDHYLVALSRRSENPTVLYSLGVVMGKMGSPSDVMVRPREH